MALITGAGSGIGAAAVDLFAREGAYVAIVDIDHDAACRTAAHLEEAVGPRRVLAVMADVALETDVVAALDATARSFGRLDIIYGKAGVQLARSAEDTTVEEWDRVLAVNLRALFLLAKHGVPHLRRAGGGAIISTASVSGMVGQVHRPAYVASKGGVMALTKALALDYAHERIRVNCVASGFVDTPLQPRPRAPGAESVLTIRVTRTPIERLVQPEEVAATALFLASDEAAGVTGATLVVDGGLLAGFEYPPSSGSEER